MTTRSVKRGGFETTTLKANLPAWAAIVGGAVVYLILREEGRTKAPPGGGSGGGGANTFWDILKLFAWPFP